MVEQGRKKLETTAELTEPLITPDGSQVALAVGLGLRRR